MNNKVAIISYTLAALAGICFVQGIVILSRGERRFIHGQNKRICRND